MTFSQLLRILVARSRLIILVLALVVGLAVFITLLLPEKYTSTVSVVVDYKESVMGTAVPAQFSNSYMATQVDIITSPKVSRRVVALLDLASNPIARERYLEETAGKGSIEQWLANALSRGMEVIPSRDSRVILIRYESLDPKFSADVANAFAQAYIETNLELSVEPARQSAEWFDKQLTDLRKRVEASQRQLAAYQQAQGIVATDERLDLETSRLNAISAQLAVAQLEAQNAEDKLKQMERLLDKGAELDTLPEVFSNAFIQTLKSQLVLQEARLTEATQNMGRNHPEYKLAASEVQNLRRKLTSEMRTVIGGIRNNASLAATREAELAKSLAAQKVKVLELKGSREQLPALVGEVESAQRAYDAALSQFSDNTLQSRVNQTNVAVLNPAVEPIAPSSPNAVLNISLATFFGLFLGINVSLLWEIVKRRVRSEEDLHTLLTQPVLATLHPEKIVEQPSEETQYEINNVVNFPNTEKNLGQILVDSGKIGAEKVEAVLAKQAQQRCLFGEAALALDLVTDDDLRYALSRQYNYQYLRPGEGGLAAELVAAYRPFSSQVETLRLLRSNIMLSWFEQEHKTLTIVSPGAAEGRSYLTANLAVVFSQLGKRTLVIDGDLRNPRQHVLFNVSNDVGLGTLLSGRANGHSVRRLATLPGLEVLPAGPKPPNPTELLGNPQLVEILEKFRRDYDAIFIDTPAFDAVADAKMLTARARGGLVIARCNVSFYDSLQKLDKDVTNVRGQLIGAVLNRF